MRTAASRQPRRKNATVASCIALLTVLSGTSLGQGNLATLDGLTELQQPTATVVNEVCVNFRKNGYRADASGTPEQRLFYTCRAMVQTANKLAGSQVDIANSLDISNPELRTGVQAVSPVQMNAQKQMNVEASKMGLVASRLLDLRGGTRGMVVGLNGQAAPQSTAAASSRTSGLAGATGGGASADDLMGGKWGGFVNIGYSWGDVDQTTLQDAYKYDSFNVLLGADYRVSDTFVLGGAISYSDTHSDYEQSLGNVKARTTGVAGYGTYYVDNWYVDGFVAYGHVDYDSTRNIFIPSNNTSNPAVLPINTSATASPNGDQWSISIGVGRNFDSGALILTPTARLGYIWVKNKAFSESEPVNGLGLAVDSRTIQSLQSALGGKVSTNINTSTGVFGPYFSAYWMHEFENDNPSIVSKYVNDPFNTIFAIPTANPTRDYAVVTVGSTATFPNNFSGFLHFSAALGLEDATNYAVILGVRKQF